MKAKTSIPKATRADLSRHESQNWGSEEAKIIRDMIIHESEAINQRVNWLVTLQGLLFTALAFAWDKNSRAVIYIIGFLGITTSVSILLALISDYLATVRWIEEWENHKAQDYNGPRIMGYPSGKSLVNPLMPWFLVPIAFVLAWVAVLIVNKVR
jgi:hypothetical protein